MPSRIKRTWLCDNKCKNSETGRFEHEYRVYVIPFYCEILSDGNIINRKTNLVVTDQKSINLSNSKLKETQYYRFVSLLFMIYLYIAAENI